MAKLKTKLPNPNNPTAIQDCSGYLKRLWRNDFHFGQSKQELRDNADSLLEEYLKSHKANTNFMNQVNHLMNGLQRGIDLLQTYQELDKKTISKELEGMQTILDYTKKNIVST